MALLKIKNLTIEFHDTVPSTKIVEDISFSMEEGEILGIVGESGSGKTQTALSVMGLLGEYARMPKGEILFQRQYKNGRLYPKGVLIRRR